MPITEKIKSHLKLKSKKATSPYPNISRILTKINAIPCSCLFIQSHSFVKFKFVDFILLQNYEQFNHRKRGIMKSSIKPTIYRYTRILFLLPKIVR